jgi:cytochrome oxidase Cu insertion factor (SCO1/SenC/PrrC family)
VTNGQFLEFARTHPEWRRDRIARLFADEGYLSQWGASDSLGPQVQLDQPVTRVSWFAARAYCASTGGRLPKWNEWELAAAADERIPDARADATWRARVLDWYAHPATDPLKPVGLGPPNLYGVQDLHGLIWEWVEDYSSLMVSGDSRNQGDPDKLEFCGAGSISAQDRENYPVLMRVAFLSALEGRSTARRLGFRCADGPTAPPQARTELPNATTMGPAPRTLSGDSLYQLPIAFETSEGNTLPLSAFRGKPLLVTMFYGHCNSVCPMLTARLQILEGHLAPDARANTRFLMVSLDSDNDTPAELSDFKRRHHIGDSRWVIARTNGDDVRLLAAVLGIRYRQLPDQSFNHSTMVALADREGVIQARLSGVQSSDAEIVRAASSLFAGEHRVSGRWRAGDLDPGPP